MTQSTTYTENSGSEPIMKKDWFIISWFVVAHAIAIIGPFYYTSASAIWLAVGLYYLTGMFGITLGYHRLLSHRAFKAPKWVERVLATCGVLALQRSPVEWVGHHRMHHAFSDTAKDPHDASKGFWWSHLLWMCVWRSDINNMQTIRKYARDISADPYLNWLTNHWVQAGLQVGLGLLLIALGGIDWAVWGIFVRVVVVYHVTWFVNSATHKWGYKNYKCDDLSRNIWWVGLLAFGEGWHNNHHAVPDVAPAGRRWWEFDLTWQIIKLMKVSGLAYDIKLPAKIVKFPTPIPESGKSTVNG